MLMRSFQHLKHIRMRPAPGAEILKTGTWDRCPEPGHLSQANLSPLPRNKQIALKTWSRFWTSTKTKNNKENTPKQPSNQATKPKLEET